MGILSTSYRPHTQFIETKSFAPKAATMVLKRKRSDSEISTTSSLLNTSPLSSANTMSIDLQSPYQIHTPSLFSSRTRKRHRDNRPDEFQVHRKFAEAQTILQQVNNRTEHTLSLLFSAQNSRQSEIPTPPLFHQQQQAPVTSLPNSNLSSIKSQQSSLHSFWTLPSARQSSPSSNASSSGAPTPTIEMASPFQASNCEDCDVSLNSRDDSMDIDMMDIDISANGGNHSCSRCGKQVCSRCAVSNLGMERKCLGCAGKSGNRLMDWGWMDRD